MMTSHGPLSRYVKLLVAHAPGMPGTFSPPPRVSDPGMHHGTCVTHVPWCTPRSLTKGFLRCRWRGKRSRHFRRMRNPQLYISGKRPIGKYYSSGSIHATKMPSSAWGTRFVTTIIDLAALKSINFPLKLMCVSFLCSIFSVAFNIWQLLLCTTDDKGWRLI